jgi:hypothetical protein
VEYPNADEHVPLESLWGMILWIDLGSLRSLGAGNALWHTHMAHSLYSIASRLGYFFFHDKNGFWLLMHLTWVSSSYPVTRYSLDVNRPEG